MQKLLIYIRFHGVPLGNQHAMGPKQHNGKVQIPPDLVVKCQTIDIVEVIFSLI